MCPAERQCYQRYLCCAVYTVNSQGLETLRVSRGAKKRYPAIKDFLKNPKKKIGEKF